MNLTEEVKNLIEIEYKAFEDFMYAGKTKEERDELAQFFTPPEISFKLLEAYKVEDLSGKIIRDPTSGSGNLLAACIIAGADLDKVLGNDYDATMVKLCRERIKTIPDRLAQYDKEFADKLREKLKDFNDWQIHRGDARDTFCLTKFGPGYKEQLKEHFKHQNKLKNNMATERCEQTSLFDDEYSLDALTPEQEEFLKEVD